MSAKSVLKEHKFDTKVSSVLNKNVKSYGKQFMFDNDTDTCWNSDAGEQQWVLISFEDSVELSAIEIQFQGGFCAPKFHLEAGPDSKNLKSYDDFYPDITNSKQTFLLSAKIKEKVFKIVFDGSSDFFGRITVYSLDLLCSAAG